MGSRLGTGPGMCVCVSVVHGAVSAQLTMYGMLVGDQACTVCV